MNTKGTTQAQPWEGSHRTLQLVRKREKRLSVFISLMGKRKLKMEYLKGTMRLCRKTSTWKKPRSVTTQGPYDAGMKLDIFRVHSTV